MEPDQLARQSSAIRAGWAQALNVNIRYAVIIERSETGFGAHVPDLPGCVAAGATRDEVA
jgi:hypothetical protein